MFEQPVPRPLELGQIFQADHPAELFRPPDIGKHRALTGGTRKFEFEGCRLVVSAEKSRFQDATIAGTQCGAACKHLVHRR